jgi:LytS/YehU family sensor histidine kinase
MAFGFIVMASVMLLLLSWLVNWVVMFILVSTPIVFHLLFPHTRVPHPVHVSFSFSVCQ